MFIQAESKVRFGEQKLPYVNVDHIVSIEIGHDDNVNVKLTTNEEVLVTGENAKKLLEYARKGLL